MESLPVAKTVNALDGRVLATVTHKTAPITLLLSGNRRETLSLLVISSPAHPLVLELPLLKLHNPHIDGPSCTILSWNPRCSSTCLHSALPSTPLAASPETSNPASVPPHYHDLTLVFSKEKATRLPPHRPYDCVPIRKGDE